METKRLVIRYTSYETRAGPGKTQDATIEVPMDMGIEHLVRATQARAVSPRLPEGNFSNEELTAGLLEQNLTYLLRGDDYYRMARNLHKAFPRRSFAPRLVEEHSAFDE